MIDSYAIPDASLTNNFDDRLVAEKVELESVPGEAEICAKE